VSDGRTPTRPEPIAFAEDIPATDDVVEAIGKASEALEWVERARGHLYSFHQLMGRADAIFSTAAELLEKVELSQDSARMTSQMVGRNVIDGRWTFQIVEEFDDVYYQVAVETVRALERDHLQGRRHVYEARLKEAERTRNLPGHEHRPPTSHDARVETDTNAGGAP